MNGFCAQLDAANIFIYCILCAKHGSAMFTADIALKSKHGTLFGDKENYSIDWE